MSLCNIIEGKIWNIITIFICNIFGKKILKCTFRMEHLNHILVRMKNSTREGKFTPLQKDWLHIPRLIEPVLYKNKIF